MTEEVSLRPLSLKPGGAGPGNPFAAFGKGLGFTNKSKHTSLLSSISDEQEPKKSGNRIKYPKEFLMKFMNQYTKCPVEVEQQNLNDIVVNGEDQKEAQKEALAKVKEEIDDRDWRTRTPSSARDREFDFSEREAPRAVRETPKSAAPREPRSDVQAREDQRAAPRDTPAAEAPAPRAAPQQQQQAPAAASAPAEGSEQAAAPEGDAKAPRAESSKVAYRVGGPLSAEDRAMRSVKGILNKLTPEKFERLLNQLLEVITSADILKSTISLVFESAVEQPTYCAMYADLCVHLSRELPSFPPPAGSDKPISFKQILLNTCQDEFEGAEEAREKAVGVSDGAEKEEAERAVKKRVMGNMRLISELYKQDMVKDWILITCIDELLMARTKKGDKAPPEANIEAVCEIFNLGGGRLSKSDKPETAKKLDKALKELARLADERAVASRIRFLIKDVLELKRMNWVPRKEVYTAKKLDEVRAQAEAELGMISSTIASSLPSLQVQSRYEATRADEFMLLPPLRGGEAAGDLPGMGGASLFPPLRTEQQANNFSGKSALLGEWTQPTVRVAQQAPPPSSSSSTSAPAQAPSRPAPGAPTAAAAPSGKELSEEELKRKCVGLYEEFCSTLDVKEGLACIGELNTRDKSKILEHGLDAMLNAVKDKERDALQQLLLAAHAAGLVSSQDLMDALATYTTVLEDLAMDVPKAPQLLGSLYGAAVSAGSLGLDLLPALLEGESGADVKRRFAATALLALVSSKGEGWVAEQAAAHRLAAGSFLAADPEFDTDAEPLEAWLSSQGLSKVLPL